MRSPPPARWTTRPNWMPPRKPESVSKVSSSLPVPTRRSEEHTSELQSLMRISYAVFCLKKKKVNTHSTTTTQASTQTIHQIPHTTTNTYVNNTSTKPPKHIIN